MAVAAVATGFVTAAGAGTITVTDIAGRTLRVETDPARVVLGEGRLLYALALLDREQPFEPIAGWRDDLITADPDAYRKYLAAFPEAEAIPRPGSPYSAGRSLETVISIGTELENPTENTVPSIQLLGRILDERDNAGAFTDFYNEQIHLIDSPAAERFPESSHLSSAQRSGEDVTRGAEQKCRSAGLTAGGFLSRSSRTTPGARMRRAAATRTRPI